MNSGGLGNHATQVRTMSAHTLSRNLFLGAAGLSFLLLSAYIWFGVGAHHPAILVGLWGPSTAAPRT